MGLGQYSPEGVPVSGVRGTHGKRREQHLVRLVNKIFSLREQGMSYEEIKKAAHTSDDTIRRILHDPMHVRNRLERYNEKLRAACPQALKVVYDTLASESPQLAGERARMAMWVLESTKTVGKESPVNIFIKGGDTNITMSNDTLEAAKAVAAAMRAAPLALPAGEVIDAEVIGSGVSEDSVGNETVTVDTPTPGSSEGNSSGL